MWGQTAYLHFAKDTESSEMQIDTVLSLHALTLCKYKLGERPDVICSGKVNKQAQSLDIFCGFGNTSLSVYKEF